MDKKELSAYFTALGQQGGKARWKGKDKAEIMTHMRKMVEARKNKSFPQV